MSEESLKEQVNTSSQEISGKWIQRLKEESWEAELLISAIAIFGTFQLFDVIYWATNKVIDYLPPTQYFIGYMLVFFGLLAVSILVSMFVIHFFLRAYWVGLVGLNSVFPDYGLKDSAYSEIYTKNLLSILPKLKDSLQKIDELCSVIFSAAFYIFLIYLYISLFASAYIFIFNSLTPYISSVILFIPAILLISLFVFQTLLYIICHLSNFRQNAKLHSYLFKLTQLTSWLSYGPMYKYQLQVGMTFATNYKKKKALISLILVFLASGIGTATYKMNESNLRYLNVYSTFFDETQIYNGFYHTENVDKNYLLSPEIDSDVIKAGVIKIFIPTYQHEAKLQEEVCGTFESEDEDSARRLEKAFELDCYHQYHQVLLDDQLLSMSYLISRHPQTKQWGIVGYINTSNLDVGNHVMTVKKVKGDHTSSEWTIPFYFLGYSAQNFGG